MTDLSITVKKKVPIDDILNAKPAFLREESDEIKNLRKQLNKLKKQELIDFAVEQHNIQLKQRDRKLQKSALAHRIAQFLVEKQVDLIEAALELKLKYTENHIQSRVWKSLRIIDAKNLVEDTTTAEEFSRIFKTALDYYDITAKIVSDRKDDTIWSIVSFDEGRLSGEAIFACFVRVPFVLHCFSKVALQKPTFKVLQRAFHGSNFENFDFKNKSFDSLLQFSYNKCDDINDTSLPQALEFQVKERVVGEEPPLPLNVINQNIKIERQRKRRAKRTFGKYEMPAIQKLSYNVTCDKLGDRDILSKCKMVFKGKNVLEGFRSMMDLGIAKYPLPGYMVAEPLAGVFDFTLRQLTEDSSE